MRSELRKNVGSELSSEWRELASRDELSHGAPVSVSGGGVEWCLTTFAEPFHVHLGPRNRAQVARARSLEEESVRAFLLGLWCVVR